MQVKTERSRSRFHSSFVLTSPKLAENLESLHELNEESFFFKKKKVEIDQKLNVVVCFSVCFGFHRKK